MPPRKRTESAPTDDVPTRRICATDEVNERLLRTVPGYADTRSEIENRTGRMVAFEGAVLRTGCTSIPVVVHVVHRTTAENISDAQVQSQIDVLNEDFRARNADRTNTPAPFQGLVADARITFRLATTDPDGNPTNGITRTSTTRTSFNSEADDVKSASTGGADPWPADQYLNIWTCGNLRNSRNEALLGYAQFPGGPAATDGVVVLHSAFGTTGSATAPFDRGRTTTHEIGHWLNLRHIWGDDGTGCSGDDFVADTPNAAGPNFGAPTFPNITCGNGPHGDLFMNYMDYVDDAAMFMFTHGQVARMQAALDGARSTIGTTAPCRDKGFADDIVKPLPTENVKDFIKERPKELVKEPVKELPKDVVKDTPKDTPKEFVKERPKELVKELPKDGGFDPKDFVEGPDFPQGPVVQPVQPGLGGQVPFVLGGQARGAAGGGDPLLPLVQQVGALLSAYSSAAQQGTLSPRDSARWQQLSAVYAQLVALLG